MPLMARSVEMPSGTSSLCPRSVLSSSRSSIIVIRSSSMGTIRTLPLLPFTVRAFSRSARSAAAVSMRKHSWIRRPA